LFIVNINIFWWYDGGGGGEGGEFKLKANTHYSHRGNIRGGLPWWQDTKFSVGKK